MKESLLFFIFLASISHLRGQSFFSVREERSLILTAGTGTSTYFGELANPGDYIDAKPNLNIGLQYFVTSMISIRSEVNWFQLQGSDLKADDVNREIRNLSFKSNNFEVNLTGHLSLYPQGRRFYQRPGINVYGFGGIGLLYFNPKAEYQGQVYELQPLQTELISYKRWVPVIPFGLGIKFKAGPFFNIGVEGGWRKTFTDYLDDVSTTHPDPALFADNPIGLALSDRGPEVSWPAATGGEKRGNPEAEDGYMLVNIKMEYYLPTDFNFGGQKRLYRNKRRAFYRYNRRGGLRR